MIIKEIHIGGFGIFNGFSLTTLYKGVKDQEMAVLISYTMVKKSKIKANGLNCSEMPLQNYTITYMLSH